MTLIDSIGRVFDFIRRRKQDYQLTFTPVHGQRVLQDLSHFCRGKESVYCDDIMKTYVMIGRREVYDRIANNLHLTSAQLYKIATGAEFNPTGMETDSDELLG